jgi:hypothetical protein
MGLFREQYDQISASTNNNDWSDICNLTVPDNCSFRVRATVIARSPVDGTTKSWSMEALYKRAAGTSTQLWEAVVPSGEVGAALWDADFRSDSEFVFISVKGSATEPLIWTAEFSGTGVHDA